MFQPPDVCPYQAVQYNFTLVIEIDNSTHKYGPTSAISHEFNKVTLSPHYLLTIAVWDELGHVYFSNKTIGKSALFCRLVTHPKQVLVTYPKRRIQTGFYMFQQS